MKKIILIIIGLHCNLLFSQGTLEGTLLERNKDKICDVFEQMNEFDSVFTCSDIPRFLFRTLIADFKDINLKYYKIGYVLEGRRVYICYSYNGDFEIFIARDFDKEFNKIFEPLIENEINISSAQLFHLIKTIKLIYNRNERFNGKIKYSLD